jgi:hypothetical protein
LLLQNNLLDAISLLKRALEELHAQRQEMLNMDFACDLAAALMRWWARAGTEADPERNLCPQRVGSFLHMPALFRMKGLLLAFRSAEDHFEAEGSLLSAIDWAKRQSAPLFELKAATDFAELLLKQRRVPEAYKHLSAALDGMPGGIVSPAHTHALQILNRAPNRYRGCRLERTPSTTVGCLHRRIQVRAFRYKPLVCSWVHFVAGMVTAGFECNGQAGRGHHR